MVVHLNDETAAPAEKPADERTAALDDDRVRALVDLDAEPLGHPRLEELVEGAPPAAAGIGLTSHHGTVSRWRMYDGLCAYPWFPPRRSMVRRGSTVRGAFSTDESGVS